MLERISQIVSSAGQLLRAESKLILNRLGRLLSAAAVLIALGIVASIAALTLGAAAIVALAPHVGVAAALAIVGGLLLVLSIGIGFAVCASLRRATLHAPATEAEQQVVHERDMAVIHLTASDKPAPPATEPGQQQPFKVDPIFIAAAAGAAVAVLGPSRIIRLAGAATAGLGVLRTAAALMPAASQGMAMIKAARSAGARGTTNGSFNREGAYQPQHV